MSLLLTAAVVASSVALGDTDGGRSDFSRDMLLVTRPPYPANRVTQGIRRDSGLLWYSTSPIGTRTPINSDTLVFPGPAYYGAPADASTDLVLIRTREPMPLVAISPYTRFGQVDVDLLKRQMPWIRRTPTIERDIQRAQHLWLRENGLILGVRTHVNPATLARGAGAPAEESPSKPASSVEPRGVIRVQPVDPAALPPRQADAAGSVRTFRISTPATSTPRAPIIVVRPAGTQAAIPEAPRSEG